MSTTNPMQWLSGLFDQAFGVLPRVFRAPGRINLIGEHTDYNHGWVMPAAIDLHCYVAIAPSQTANSTIVAQDLGERYVFNALPKEKTAEHWVNYALGVAQAFNNRGVAVPPFNAIIHSNVPIGAGMSSSAALESAAALAINALTAQSFSRLELAKIAQEAEDSFVGLHCGIMDMFVSLHAQKNHAIKLDCKTLEFEQVPLQLANNRILLFDTCIKHDLASSEYNKRRAECGAAVAYFRSQKTNSEADLIQSLRDVSPELLGAHRSSMDEIHYQRAKHVVGENARLHQFANAIAGADWVRAGQLLHASHASLRDDYAVSCAELDWLVDAVADADGVWGARMMGGGFGGCTLNLVEVSMVDALVARVCATYQSTFGVTPKYYIANTGDGATEIY